MSFEEVVIKEAKKVSDFNKEDIHLVFKKNASFFAQHNSHNKKYISKLFSYYNKFFSFDKFDEEDTSCIDCQTTIVKFWSTVIYDIWERKIV